MISMRKTTWFAVLAALLTTIVIPGFISGLPTAFKRQTPRAAEPDLGSLVWTPPGLGRDLSGPPPAGTSPEAILAGLSPSMFLDKLGVFLGESATLAVPDVPLDDLHSADAEDLMRTLSELSLPRHSAIPDEVVWTVHTLNQLASSRIIGNLGRMTAPADPVKTVIGTVPSLPTFVPSTIGNGVVAANGVRAQAPVPEPASGLLLACGAVALVVLRKSRRP